jgi:formate dehydrogenase iron-sulfur subunit
MARAFAREPIGASPGSRQENIALPEDLCETMRFGSLCALGGFSRAPASSALKHWPEDFE